MKTELKAQWIAALRSGEYKQGKTFLRSIDDEYCCIGVLCDIHSDGSGWVPSKTTNAYEIINTGRTCILSKAMQDLFGLDDETIDRLMSMNDYYEDTFEEIADWIEENL